MKPRLFFHILILLIVLSFTIVSSAQEPAIKMIIEQAGIKPDGFIRGQMDIVGYPSTAIQMEAVMAQCTVLSQPALDSLISKYGWDDETKFIAGICPHDDYYYAGRLYPLVLSKIKAKRVIIFGVSHKARMFNMQDKIVFDSYKFWRGPFGLLMVPSLREEIMGKLSLDDYVINNDMQMIEHSVEGIVPFLQAYNKDVEIVSILVPYMDWETTDRLAKNLSDALAEIMKANNWKLGEDLSIVCSSDAVHYGDAEWGGSNYAEFGCGIDGYKKAVDRDIFLAENFFCGDLEMNKLKDFLYSCVDEKDVHKYLITWCGRFSIPFGMNVASRLTEKLENRTLTGYMLDYGTSVSEISLDLQNLDGMGMTAPNNLHHWVGYAAIGYK